ncbi:MAG TPA: hypothetical protein VMF89_23225 [Polyangiales bacterium]|nr:hypothetical protein [Polyangiales bacterium]
MSHGFRATSFLLLALAASGCGTTTQLPPSTAKSPQPLPADATLQFSELFASGSSELQPSATAQQLVGKRVRMVGFMAELEHGPVGSFYLTAQPVHCDESGAGTADLPIASVKVAVPFAANKRIPHIDGALEVIGAFELGNETDAQGFPSSFRLRLDDKSANAQALSSVSHR